MRLSKYVPNSHSQGISHSSFRSLCGRQSSVQLRAREGQTISKRVKNNWNEKKKTKTETMYHFHRKKKTLKTSVQFNERGYRGIVEAVIPNSVRCHVKSVFQMHDAYYTITNQWYLFCFLCSQKYDKWSWSQYSTNLIDRRMAFISQSNNNHCAHFFRFLHQFIYVNIYYYRQFNITHVSLSICILSYK